MPAIRDLGEDGEEAASSTLRDLRDVVSPEVPGESRIIEAARIKATHPMAYPDAFAAATASRRCLPSKRVHLAAGDSLADVVVQQRR